MALPLLLLRNIGEAGGDVTCANIVFMGRFVFGALGYTGICGCIYQVQTVMDNFT